MLSQEIIRLEALCNDHLQRPDISSILRALQESEKNKLQLTSDLYALKNSGLLHRDDGAIGEDHIGCGCLGEAPLPQEAKQAAAEAYRQLEVCIHTINDFIQELQHLKVECVDS